MALNPLARYAGQVATSDPAGYPYGKAQNVTVEGDGTGTPLEKDLVNDILGLQQALLVAAGITPSGVSDKANASQYLDAIRWIAEGARATFDVKDPRYGATGLGVIDDTLKIQAALTAAGLVRGRVYFPEGTYRTTTELLVPAGVSLLGDDCVILNDHASAHTLVWASASTKPVTVEGIRFEGAQVNTGNVWRITAGVNVTFIRCAINASDNKLHGQLCRSTSAASAATFYRCEAAHQAVGEIGVESLGKVAFVEGSYSVPGNYNPASGFIDAIVTSCDRVSFTQLLSTVGGFAFVVAHEAMVRGCKFRVTDSGAAALTYATSIVSGSILVSQGNDFGTQTGGYCFPCKGTGAARGSVIQLLPATRQTVAGGTLVLQSHYESIGVKYSASSPTFQMPDPKVEGQKLNVTFFNTTGGALGFGVTNYGFKASQPTPAASSGASATFVATDPTDTGTLVWSQVGGWGSIAA
jgi:hypothetical protein